MTLSMMRIQAMFMRYFYLLMSSWPRMLEMVYWPTVQLILWGFITQYLTQHSSVIAQAFGVLLAAVMLWDVMFRGQLGLSISFLEEMWSRNLGHIFVSPLRPMELIAALMGMSLVRVLIGMIPASFICVWLFGYSIYDLGLPLLGFFANLMVMGWAIGLGICGLLLRYGLAAEVLAWAVVFAIAPLCAVYYPVDILPQWLQPVALIMPGAHVFEGMRGVLIDGAFSADHLLYALGLNAVYTSLAIWWFRASINAARMRAALLQVGE